jgi:hypothetical protein
VLARRIISSSRWIVIAVAITVLSATFVAQSQDLRLLGQFGSISASSTIDRSLKGDRLAPAASAVNGKTLIGCEPPFSVLAKISSSSFIARCLT